MQCTARSRDAVRGSVWFGEDTYATAKRAVLLRSRGLWLGVVWHRDAGLGEASEGEDIHAKGSRRFDSVGVNRGQVRQGGSRPGLVRQGSARRGEVTHVAASQRFDSVDVSLFRQGAAR